MNHSSTGSEAVSGFRDYLLAKQLSANTIRAYTHAVRQFLEHCREPEPANLAKYRAYLMDAYRPQTVNLHICALNAWLEFSGLADRKLNVVKSQQKPFLEYVISNADYTYLKECLRNPQEIDWYFVIRFMAATGARVSELLQFKAEHVDAGYLDLYAKGGKLRRIYIPAALRSEALAWMRETGRSSGFLFVNKAGRRLTQRGIAARLKQLAAKYGLDPAVVYPHSFRHRFAKNFLERCSDIALLADLMGHESIETTRIYLRKTSTEQRAIVDQVIDW